MDPSKRFQCTRCGACCRWPGYVRLTEKEVDEIAEFLEMTIEEFIETCTILTKDRRCLSLIEHPDDGRCILLTNDGRCRINPVKPRQCRNFPNLWNFPGWQNICKARDTWDENSPS